jgi:hypothetical protein
VALCDPMHVLSDGPHDHYRGFEYSKSRATGITPIRVMTSPVTLAYRFRHVTNVRHVTKFDAFDLRCNVCNVCNVCF